MRAGQFRRKVGSVMNTKGWSLYQSAHLVALLNGLPIDQDSETDELTIWYGGRRHRWYDWFIALFTFGQAKCIECPHFCIYPHSTILGIGFYVRYM